jgi:outer membrane immunogenic protein
MTQYGNIREKSLLLQPDTRLHAPLVLMLMVRPGILGVIGGYHEGNRNWIACRSWRLGTDYCGRTKYRTATAPSRAAAAAAPSSAASGSPQLVGRSDWRVRWGELCQHRLRRARRPPLPVRLPDQFAIVETPFSLSGNKTTPTGGLFLGYRWQFGTAVFGIEGDANAESGSASYAFSDSNRFRSESFTGAVKEGADGSIRGRFGLLVTPQTLVYGTGGIAFGRVGGSFSYAAYERFDDCLPCASAVGEGSWSTIQPGATGGAGIETVITPALTLRLEYRYTDFGRFSENVYLYTICASICSSPSSNALINLHANFQVVRLGLGYNF